MVSVGRAGLEQCKSRSERSMRGALGTFSVCTHHAWECSVNSQHVNDKEEQSFLPRERTIKPRSQRSSHVEKEGSCCYSEASVIAGNKLVTHQAAVPPPSLAHGGLVATAWLLTLGHRLGSSCTALEVH